MVKIGNIEAYGIIYKITNKVNGKVYIGQTTKEKGFNGRYQCNGIGVERVYNYIKSRMKDKNNGSYNKYLYNSIKKYGFENFEVNKIFDVAFSLNELNIKEELWIKYYNSTNRKFGYNFRNGGDNYEYSNDSLVRNGTWIICIDDNLIFKSISEASNYYGLSKNYIKKTFNKKHTYYNYKNEIPVFRKINNYIPPHVKYCSICGKTFEKMNNSNRKYCKKCSDEIRTSYKNIDYTLIKNDYDKNYSKNQLYINEYILLKRKNELSELKDFIKSFKITTKRCIIQSEILKKYGYEVSSKFIGSVIKKKNKYNKN